MEVTWSVYWEREDLPPLRVRCSSELSAREEYNKYPQYPGFLAKEEIVEKRGDSY